MQIKLSKIALAVAATTLLVASSSVFAHNYKGEGNYKGEAMAAPAAPCVQPLALRDGFYLGAQVGYDSYRIKTSSSETDGDIFSLSHTSAIATNGFEGGIFGGYGMYWNNFYYLGAELFVNGSGANQTEKFGHSDSDDSSSLTSKTSVGASWGVSALPGLKVNDSTLMYVRLGYEQARITAKGTGTVTATGAGSFSFSQSKTSWQGGFNYGVGLETAVYTNLSVRGEFNHTGYSSFRDARGISFDTSDNQFNMGLSYHFA